MLFQLFLTWLLRLYQELFVKLKKVLNLCCQKNVFWLVSKCVWILV